MAIKILEIREEGKSTQVLTDFVRYCREHPEERFWQALRNFSGYPFLYVSSIPSYGFDNDINILDTFYWEGKRHDENNTSKRI